MSGLSPRAQELFAQLGEELKRDTGDCGQLLLIYDPEHDRTYHVHTFESTRVLAQVLQTVLRRVRSGEHQRTRRPVLRHQRGGKPS